MRCVRAGIWMVLLLAVAFAAARAAEYKTFDEAAQAGETHLFLWRIQGGAEAYDAALQLAETDRQRAQAMIGQGQALYFSGRYEEAREIFAEVLGMPGLSRDEEFFANQFTAHCYLQQGRFAEALDAYQKCLAARPSLRRNAFNDIVFAGMDAVNAGRRRHRLGEHDAAIQALNDALKLEALQMPERRKAWVLKGDCRLATGDLRAARDSYEAAMDLKPLAPDGWLESRALAGIARSYELENDAARARAAWLAVWNQDDAHPNLRAEAKKRLMALGAASLTDKRKLDTQYGAEVNPTGSPIGGGEGYANIVTSGHYDVATLDELLGAFEELSAMPEAERKGRVVYVKPDAEINFAGQTRIVIPSGITLAGNRGRNGSPGPLLYTDKPLLAHALMVPGNGARVTGLRIRGDAPPFSEMFGMWPDSLMPSDYFKQPGRHKPTATALFCGDRVEVDNCEIFNFQHAISIYGTDLHAHHNHIHDVHAYPVMFGGEGRRPLIEANDIEWAWHAIATGDNMVASFVARYNIFREVAPNLFGQGISYKFAIDHHGRGGWFVVHHNTFLHMDRAKGVPNVSIALTPPWDIARIHNNWFRDYMEADEAVFWSNAPSEFVSRPTEMTDVREIVKRQGLSRHMWDYLDEIEDFSAFDMREMAATTRAGTGGQNMWIYDNAYGVEKDVLATTLFTTQRILLHFPAHRQIRTGMGRGRGGPTNAVLHHLRGEVPIDIEIEVLDGLELKRVIVDFITPDIEALRSGRESRVRYRYVPGPDETRRLYEGASAPKPGEIVLDTRELPNGLYGLMVIAEDERGIKCDQNTFFGIVNP